MTEQLIHIISILGNLVEDPIERQVLLIYLQLGITALHQVVQPLPLYLQPEHGFPNQDIQFGAFLDKVLGHLYQLGNAALVLGQLG